MRGATWGWSLAPRHHQVSIHAPHARGDCLRWDGAPVVAGFNPRPSCEGRLLRFWLANACNHVSIHAPHARGDRALCGGDGLGKGFNPRPSCEGRLLLLGLHGLADEFQSTPLMRGATTADTRSPSPPHRFNPRPSCEGRRPRRARGGDPHQVSIHAPHARGDWRSWSCVLLGQVSIHAPHARGDWPCRCRCQGRRSFNPRPSCEGRHVSGQVP